MAHASREGKTQVRSKQPRPVAPAGHRDEVEPVVVPLGTVKAPGDAQAYRHVLADQRLPEAQQRAVASRLGRTLGNRQLQAMAGRTAVQAKDGDKKDAPKAPIDLLRDELDDVFVDERACLGYIAQLGPQAATVRNDKTMMAQMAGAFNAEEMLQAVRQLAVELKWSIYWLDRAREAGSVRPAGYDTLIASSPAGQVAQLIGWEDMLGVVKRHRPGNPLTMFPPLNANDPMLAHVFGAYGHYVDWTLTDAGAPQLLHFMLGHSPKRLVGGLDKSGRWTPFLTKLPKGMALAPTDKSALQRLAVSTGDAAKQAQLFEVRFDVSTRAAGSKAWASKGLMRAWEVLNTLPAGDVEGNPNLDKFLYMGTKVSSGLSDMSTYVKYWYQAGEIGTPETGQYTEAKDPMRGMKLFERTILHEIGHNVDGPTLRYSGNFSGSGGGAFTQKAAGGGWKRHTPAQMVDAMVAASPWSIKLPAPAAAGPAPAPGKPLSWGDKLLAGLTTMAEANVKAQARQAAINAATHHKTVQSEANAIDASGQLWKLIQNQPVVKAIEPAFASASPWYNHSAQTRFGSRYYHEGYANSWYSYLSDRYDAKLSMYQFRDPRDWFAEVYSCYYGSIDATNPKMEDAGKKVPGPIRSWFARTVAKTSPPPGAAKAGP